MSSSPPLDIGRAAVEEQAYQDSPFRPAPLRIPTKTRPSTPKLMTHGIEGSSSRLSRGQRDGQNSATPPAQRLQARTTAPNLVGLVSKFELLDAMSNAGTKLPASSSQRPYVVRTPSPDVSPPAESHDIGAETGTEENVLSVAPKSAQRQKFGRMSSSRSISPLPSSTREVEERSLDKLDSSPALDVATDHRNAQHSTRE
jgi:hypothetical protein